MLVYTFDNTLDGLLTAVFDSFFLKQSDVTLLAEGEQLPLFADEPHRVHTDSEKAERVWKGLEKYLSKDGLHMITVSWLSEERALNQPLFNFICKVFRLKIKDYERNAFDDDVLSENDKIFQDLWRTYFKAICIKERMNPKKQLSDMPRRYWKYMTEKSG